MISYNKRHKNKVRPEDKTRRSGGVPHLAAVLSSNLFYPPTAHRTFPKKLHSPQEETKHGFSGEAVIHVGDDSCPVRAVGPYFLESKTNATDLWEVY